MKPNTKEREIKITFTSTRRLSGDELAKGAITVSATKIDKTTPVFVDQAESAVVPVIPEVKRQKILEFSKAGT